MTQSLDNNILRNLFRVYYLGSIKAINLPLLSNQCKIYYRYTP